MILTKPYKYLATLLLGLGVASCSSSADIPKGSPSVIVDSKVEPNEFDRWLEENFIDTYNINVQYALQDNETSMRYHLSPADKQKSIQFAHLMKYLCIEPYDEVYGSNGFIRELFPKVVQLIGSPAYNTNGTIILGTAEGGRKMTFYKLNDLNLQNVDQMNEFYFHTLHHEFGHIQNQTKRFSEDFDKVTSQGYIGDTWSEGWTTPANVVKLVTQAYVTPKISSYINKVKEYQDLADKVRSGQTLTADEQKRVTEIRQELQALQQDQVFLRDVRTFNLVVKYVGGEDLAGKDHKAIFSVKEINALRAGFVSPYASNNPDEDFVEVQAYYITDSPEKWNARLLIAATSQDPALGLRALREKFTIVQNYLANEWKIDIHKLHESVQRRQKAIPSEDELNSLTLKQGGN